MKVKYVIILVIMSFVAASFFKNEFFGENIKVKISENNSALTISARFPKAKSHVVQEYLSNKLGAGELPGDGYLEMKQHESEGKLMNFYLKSGSRYVKILFDKDRNDLATYNKLKEAGEGLKNIDQ